MLTHEQICKAAKLMQQVGELRSGFIKEEASAIEGPVLYGGAFAVSKKDISREKESGDSKQKVKINLVFQKDPETGEMMIVKRE